MRYYLELRKFIQEYPMPDLATIPCPSFSEKLNITNDIKRFAKVHCNCEHAAKHVGGNAYLSLVVGALKKVEVGVDKTTSELAINRLQEEIDELHFKKAGLISSAPKLQANVVFTYLIMAEILVTVVSLSISNAWVPIL
jgi:hypothetical protein